MLQVAANNSNIPLRNLFSKWINIISHNINIKEEYITIRIVESVESQVLNKQFRDKDSPSNVLSFPTQLPEHIDNQYLGDIVICADIVEQEALAQNKSLHAHWAHMVVHGVLHLLGYDHIEPEDANKMESLEIKLLAQMGYANPYEA